MCGRSKASCHPKEGSRFHQINTSYIFILHIKKNRVNPCNLWQTISSKANYSYQILFV
jgi:hypothetical protein